MGIERKRARDLIRKFEDFGSVEVDLRQNNQRPALLSLHNKVVEKRAPMNKTQLKEAITESYEELPAGTVTASIERLATYLPKVIEAEGKLPQ